MYQLIIGILIVIFINGIVSLLVRKVIFSFLISFCVCPFILLSVSYIIDGYIDPLVWLFLHNLIMASFVVNIIATILSFWLMSVRIKNKMIQEYFPVQIDWNSKKNIFILWLITAVLIVSILSLLAFGLSFWFN